MIVTKNVSYQYNDDSIALDNISFSITDGSSVALLGGNGAGKSTLILLLLGFIYPQKGEILLNKNRISSKNIDEIRKDIGVVFQNSDDQLFMPSVYEDIIFGVNNLKLPNNVVKNRIEEAVEITGVSHLLDRRISKLSAGEKRRVALAGVFVMKPKILLMDEPTSSLDFLSTKQLVNVLKGINATKLIATHDLDFAQKACNRAIILQAGKVKAIGDYLNDKKTLTECSLC